MRIVHTEASCGWGGQELRILTEAAGFIARGHAVTLLCPPQARIFSAAPRYGIPVVALPIGRKNIAGLLAMRRWLAQHPADVVNTHSSTDSWLAALACATLRAAPSIVRTRHISAPVSANAATRWLYTRATAHIVTTGEKLRRTLIDARGYPGERITSVPTGIDTARFAPRDRAAARQALGLDPALRYVGIVATLRSWKGHHYLIEACAQLKGHDWRLLIVGDGPRRQWLEDMVARLNLAERVRFLGHRDDPELWLPALDVFCLPSYANEGVPQAMLQAMLSGLPIVTTDVGSIGEAAVDGATALVVPPEQVPPLAAALQRLLDEPELAQRLGAAARAAALERHGFETMVDAMERIFASVSRPPS
ncbi:MAG: glycosyltransferase family 4 protein [Rhodocyclales bacterium]|nr:glycosyltransferase family 4 protein [Rhodocyclales bacterium]